MQFCAFRWNHDKTLFNEFCHWSCFNVHSYGGAWKNKYAQAYTYLKINKNIYPCERDITMMHNPNYLSIYLRIWLEVMTTYHIFYRSKMSNTTLSVLELPFEDSQPIFFSFFSISVKPELYKWQANKQKTIFSSFFFFPSLINWPWLFLTFC